MESIERFGGLHAELLDQPILWRDGYVITARLDTGLEA